ncbi:hypothetical protein AMECASPLE_015120 [Ameca splendens]|uniref:Uncharacterized protein n=1 Tax=Ameca splendens TaxID=208324 RepID=A0ABV0XQN9_9TELE
MGLYDVCKICTHHTVMVETNHFFQLQVMTFRIMLFGQIRLNKRCLTIMHSAWQQTNTAYQHKRIISTVKRGGGGLKIWDCSPAKRHCRGLGQYTEQRSQNTSKSTAE